MLARLPLAKIGLGLLVLGLLLGSLLFFQARGETEVTYAHGSGKKVPADTNGSVPLVKKCEPNGSKKFGPKWVGKYDWDKVRDDSGNVTEVRGVIYLNECRMRNLNFTEGERRGVIEHERSHARGFDHGEGTPETNPAYFEDYDLDR